MFKLRYNFRLFFCFLMCIVISSGCHSSKIKHFPDTRALGPYSGAVATNGFIFVSGKIGDPSLAAFKDQVTSALDTIDLQLKEANSDWSKVVAVTVYLTDINRYAALNEVYSHYVPKPYPARVVVQVSALPANADIEIQAIATTHQANTR